MRDSDCESHFILWRSRTYWCDRGDKLDVLMAEVIVQMREALGPQIKAYKSIVERLGLVPSAVGSACVKLQRESLAVEGQEKLRGLFMRKLTRGRAQLKGRGQMAGERNC